MTLTINDAHLTLEGRALQALTDAKGFKRAWPAWKAARDRLAEFGVVDSHPSGRPLRVAHLMGQCAHESLLFRKLYEGLYYRERRLMAVWPSRFRDLPTALRYARNPEKLANKVYGGRMGNHQPGDGYRYRGRGWIHLTGRDNYRSYGKIIGMDLEQDPDLAAEPETAWLIAAAYMDRRKRKGLPLWKWADRDDVEQVTRGINGGKIGLADRRRKTAKALEVLEGPL